MSAHVARACALGELADHGARFPDEYFAVHRGNERSLRRRPVAVRDGIIMVTVPPPSKHAQDA